MKDNKNFINPEYNSYLEVNRDNIDNNVIQNVNPITKIIDDTKNYWKNIDWERFATRDAYNFFMSNQDVINTIYNSIIQFINYNNIRTRNLLIIVSRLEFNRSFLGLIPNFFIFQGNIRLIKSATTNQAPVFTGLNTFNVENVSFCGFSNPDIIKIDGKLISITKALGLDNRNNFTREFDKYFSKYQGEIFKLDYSRINRWTLVDLSNTINFVPLAIIKSMMIENNKELFDYPITAEFESLKEFNIS